MGDKVEAVLDLLGIAPRERRGARLWALCPYHDDHNPSWFIRVNPQQYGLHHCFSCKASGNLVQLVMHARGLERDAAEALIDAVDGDVPAPRQLSGTLDINPTSRFNASFTIKDPVIWEDISEWVSPPRTYLLGRGVTPEQARAWRVGYALDGRLAGRVVFPIFDMFGELASYQARTFCGTGKRYLHPPSSAAPDLDAMWGEQYWPSSLAVRRVSTLVVQEGILKSLAVDRILVHLHRVYVASLNGSPVEFRPMHLAKMASFGKVLCMQDNDQAGEPSAAALARALGRQAKHERVRLAPGTDADEMPASELRRVICQGLGRT